MKVFEVISEIADPGTNLSTMMNRANQNATSQAQGLAGNINDIMGQIKSGDVNKAVNSAFKLVPPMGRISPQVADVQKVLQNIGFDIGPTGIDGVRGPYTSNAIKQFQKSAGITVDGDPGPETIGALNQVVASDPKIVAGLTKSTDADVKMRSGQKFSSTVGTGVGSSANADTAMKFFISKGWTSDQAAGIVGNLQAESGANLKPNAVGDEGQAYGIAQWHPDRAQQFAKVVGKDIRGSSLEDQLAFVQWELTHTESKAGDRIKSCETAQDAAAAMDAYYERSSGSARGQRIGNALALMKSQTPTATA
jgi:peptidoglycan hydrolase-like protein with peptidoglycan-binding domain